MNAALRHHIVPLFLACSLTWIVGPGLARAALILTPLTTNPTTANPGETVALGFQFINTSTTDTIIPIGDVTTLTPSSADVTVSRTMPLPVVAPSGTAQVTYDLMVSGIVPTSSAFTLVAALGYLSTPTGTFAIAQAAAEPLLITATIPEPGTLTLAGLGGGCWIVYAMARNCRKPRERSAKS